jgi:hypothetical protein
MNEKLRCAGLFCAPPFRLLRCPEGDLGRRSPDLKSFSQNFLLEFK